MNQNLVSGKIYRFAILATAFFIFWIYLGSIINFHQHHIFGRALMAQGILCKREDSIQTADEAPVYIVLFSFTSGLNEKSLPEPAWKVIKTANVIHNLLAPKSGIPLFHGLRAPPIA
jgi:hypothetical protein